MIALGRGIDFWRRSYFFQGGILAGQMCPGGGSGTAKGRTRHEMRIKLATCALFTLFILVVGGGLLPRGGLRAEGQEQEAAGSAKDISLADHQREIASTFERFRGVLARLAELGSAREPERALVVAKTLRQAEGRQIAMRMNRVAELLATQRLAAAMGEQELLVEDLAALLDLLLAEHRQEELRARRKQLEAWLEQLEAISRRQVDLKSRTARAAGAKDGLDADQEKLAQETGQLRGSVEKAASPKPRALGGTHRLGARGEPGTPGEGPQEAPAPGQRPSEDGGATPSQGDRGDSGQRGGQSQAQPGTPSGGSGANSGEPAQRSTPEARAGAALSAAEARMFQAAEKLRRAQQEGALAEQEAALAELEKARAELERILRQMRQEEIARLLTGLQARLEKMLALQREIYGATEKLSSLPEAARGRDQALEIGRLGRQQAAVGWEADGLLLLLREDASAPAMYEAATHLRTDIRLVEELFAAQDIGPLNLSTQQAILAALQEMLEAVRERLEEIETARSDRAGQMAGGPTPLVDLLAELRMLRSLQERIRTRTEEYQRWLASPGQDPARLKASLRELAARQARLQEIARELASRIGQ